MTTPADLPKPRRIYPDYTYSKGPIEQCFWAEAVPERALQFPQAEGHIRTRVAVIGGGYTGLNAALALAQAGIETVLIEAQFPGFGASGRNGGFCCIGSHRASDATLKRRFGPDGAAEVNRAEAAAIAHVEHVIQTHGIEVDRHSQGEVVLAHSPAAMRHFSDKLDEYERDFGLRPRLIGRDELAMHGLYGPTWHGALLNPLGFALHPRKYLSGLVKAATAAGARIYGETPALSVGKTAHTLTITTPRARIEADRVIFATNAYVAENLAPWFRGRTLPAQSSALATRPMTEEELRLQGFSSRQMSYEDRRLLHYFHLTPDGRMVFGQRGALLSSPASEARAARKVRADFERAFPAWRHVESPWHWSGMVCLTASLTPYCGPVPGLPGAYAGFGYHGNGVAMGSYVGALLADLALDRAPAALLPRAFSAPPPRFPAGRLRRLALAAEYGWALLTER